MADEKTKKNEASTAVKGYLFFYNAIQTIGWSYLLSQIITYYITGHYKEHRIWDATKVTVLIFQNLALLEIFHVVLKFVKSSVVLTSLQVASRVFIVSFVLAPLSEAFLTPIGTAGITLAFTCWSITEIIRYSFYALSLFDSVPYFLIWCRYTFFILLYPFGVTGELICVYLAQSLAAEKNLYSLDLPNSLNITFSYRLFLVLSTLLYIPGFPPLYLYMFAQRKKIIGTGVNGDKKAK